MIPKDLIEFVQKEIPIVTDGLNLNAKLYLTYKDIYCWFISSWPGRTHDGKPVYEREITESLAAALLVNWLIEELGKRITLLKGDGGWCVWLDAKKSFRHQEDKLTVLWEVYKAVKGISNG